MSFYKETALYKEMLLLEFISKNAENISQPDIARSIDASTSMTHNYIDDFEEEGLLIREYQSKKVVYYKITDKGKKRKQYLQIRYVRELMDIYLQGQDTIDHFLNIITKKNLHKILLYGAGDVATILLDMISTNEYELDVLAVIDDDQNKIGSSVNDIQIISIDDIQNYEHDGIVITSYAYEEAILNKLKNIDYPKEKTVKYFER